MYNIFLDDYRVPRNVYNLGGGLIYLHNNDWVIAKSYDQFVSLIEKRGLPHSISFDHDLGDAHYNVPKDPENIPYEKYTEKTGMECAKWLIEYCLDNNKNLPEYYVHSANPVGAKNIKSLLDSFKNRRIKEQKA